MILKLLGHAQTISVFSMLGLSLTTAHAQQRQSSTTPSVESFYPTIEAPIERGYVGDTYSFSLGLFFSGISPITTPYTSVIGSESQALRYQIPSSYGIESSFALSSWLELGVGAEYVHYNTKQIVEIGANKRSDSVRYRAFPIVKGLARGIWNLGDGYALVSEAAMGFGKGTVSVSTSDLGTDTLEKSINSFVGHIAAGMALVWNDDYSIHTSFGYAVHTLSQSQFTSDPLDIIQSKNFNGPFAKVLMRYQF